ASLGVTGPVRAADLSALQAQQKAAAERALAAEKLAAQETAIAKQAAARVAQVSNQIESVKYSLEITSDGISDTNQGIETKNQELAKLESDLRQIQDKQDSIIRQLFILSESLPAEMNWFSNQSISEKTRMESQFKSLKNYASALYTETMTAKLAVESNKRELMTRAEQLKSLQDQQSEQKRALASYKDQQAALKLDAEAAAKQMAAKASAEREKAAKLEGQIRAEIAARQRSAQGYYGKGPGVGKRVSRGEYIGTQGSTGFSTGDHVHFEVDVNGPASGHTSPWPYLNNGTMSWPLRSFVITQDYNEYNCWYSGCRHMGIDISGPIGSAIYAPADGLVVLNEYFGGYGNAWSMKVDNGPYVLIGHMR
ncbi:MAG: peptidoglycan DD-metalloendopeptidase family protein, partial [Methanothrix sp.]